MIPCCSRCYLKYINKDGSLDFNSYALYAIKIQLVVLEHSNKDDIEKEKLKKDIIDSVCLCDCHKYGEAVLH